MPLFLIKIGLNQPKNANFQEKRRFKDLIFAILISDNVPNNHFTIFEFFFFPPNDLIAFGVSH